MNIFLSVYESFGIMKQFLFGPNFAIILTIKVVGFYNVEHSYEMKRIFNLRKNVTYLLKC